MKKNLAELVFILDRSGSMGGLEQDTIGGLENASKRFGYEKIRRMIEREKERYGWEFLFLGANMDAVQEAARFGIFVLWKDSAHDRNCQTWNAKRRCGATL